MKPFRNYGFKLDEPKDKDLVFGSSLPYEELQPDGDWRSFLPIPEFQNLNGIEPYACVTFTVLNCIEILIKRKYGIDRNYSDRFLACMSGTKEGGNSPRAVCDYLREKGVVPEDVWPFDSSVTTFEEFYKEIPEDIKKLADDFLDEWDMHYEKVPATHEMISKAIRCSPLLMSVSAWYENNEGLFYRPDGMIDNHATTMVFDNPGKFRQVFDSYDAPYIKNVDWNAIPMQTTRFSINKRASPRPKRYWFTEILLNLLDFLKDILTK